MWTALRVPRGSRGFSLLEVIVALAILAVAVVSLVQLFSISLRSTKKSADYTTALIHARSLLEEGYAVRSLEEIAGEFEFPDGFVAVREVSPLPSEDEEDTAPVYKISVTVQWPSGSLRVAGGRVVSEQEP